MAFQLVPRRNHALQDNPPDGDAHITIHASNWLFAVLAIMLISWFTALAWTFSVCPLFRLLASFFIFSIEPQTHPDFPLHSRHRARSSIRLILCHGI